jgi:hypothetical protein
MNGRRMTKRATGPSKPTFQGFVQDTTDALVLFEAYLSNDIDRVEQRPGKDERSQLAQSGNVFIYEESESGIKRWTDSIAWSPSRVLGDFFIYRELKEPFLPGSRRCVNKRKRSINAGEGGLQHGNHDSQLGSTIAASVNSSKLPIRTTMESGLPSVEQDEELERSLLGSRVDSYGFREDGLVKKTMSIKIRGITHHMVSYYRVKDVKGKLLARPTLNARFASIKIRAELYPEQNFHSLVAGVENRTAHRPNFGLPPMIHGYQQMSPGYHTCDTRFSTMHVPTATTSGGSAVTYPQFGAAISCAAFHGLGPQFAASYKNEYHTIRGMDFDSSYHANDVMCAAMRKPALRIPWSSPPAVADTVYSAHPPTFPPFVQVDSSYTTTQPIECNNLALKPLAEVRRHISSRSSNITRQSNQNTDIQHESAHRTSLTDPNRYKSLSIEYDDRSEAVYQLGDTSTPSSTFLYLRALLPPYQHEPPTYT